MLPGNMSVSVCDERWRLSLPLLSYSTSKISVKSPHSINLHSLFWHHNRCQMPLRNYSWHMTFTLGFLHFKAFFSLPTIYSIWRHFSQMHHTNFRRLCQFVSSCHKWGVCKTGSAHDDWHRLIQSVMIYKNVLIQCSKRVRTAWKYDLYFIYLL